MKLYNLQAAPNPRRVRIFLAEKGISVPVVEIDLAKGDNRTPEFLARNPLGQMPVLELDDGSIISESVAICRYFEELQPAPPLFGATTLERAQVEMWNRRAELEVMLPAIDVFVHTHAFWKGRRPQLADYGQLARERVLKNMAWLDRELGTREFLAGARYSMADITLQCGLLLGKNTGTPIPDGMANLKRWFAAVTARPTARV
ncbi:MAG TPA: glutathione S-transferase family protein [Candidatus Sulfotelmatobacter sp.]|nr:glutathione S-transferase family protein [Candidatus Sulfotelmatobacter sp.]